jgi:hypothetical protein
MPYDVDPLAGLDVTEPATSNMPLPITQGG